MTLDTPTPVARPSSLLARVGFDISRDGKRLLMVQEVKTDEQRVASLAVVQNWLAGGGSRRGRSGPVRADVVDLSPTSSPASRGGSRRFLDRGDLELAQLQVLLVASTPLGGGPAVAPP